jgi:hypothetical protein
MTAKKTALTSVRVERQRTKFHITWERAAIGDSTRRRPPPRPAVWRRSFARGIVSERSTIPAWGGAGVRRGHGRQLVPAARRAAGPTRRGQFLAAGRRRRVPGFAAGRAVLLQDARTAQSCRWRWVPRWGRAAARLRGPGPARPRQRSRDQPFWRSRSSPRPSLGAVGMRGFLVPIPSGRAPNLLNARDCCLLGTGTLPVSEEPGTQPPGGR